MRHLFREAKVRNIVQLNIDRCQIRFPVMRYQYPVTGNFFTDEVSAFPHQRETIDLTGEYGGGIIITVRRTERKKSPHRRRNELWSSFVSIREL